VRGADRTATAAAAKGGAGRPRRLDAAVGPWGPDSPALLALVAHGAELAPLTPFALLRHPRRVRSGCA